MEEIEKLRIRVEKDPNSRLFLPLAEEYRKSGMLDEAISVILSGLERQPGYTSARVALGRIYFEKNMIEEARNEFEQVVSAIPDNLFSHKKLAEIYRGRGETEKAIAEYKKVIQLNPLDEDAKICLEEIEGRPIEEVESLIEAPVNTEHEIAGEAPGELSGKEFEEFKNSFSRIDEGIHEAEGSLGPSGVDEDQAFDLSEESTLEDIFADSTEVSDLSESPVSLEDIDSGDRVDISAADSFIAMGNYYKALEIYKEGLRNNPDDKHIMQRIIELKTLMKLMGKGDEVVIARLEAFLEAIKKGFPRKS